MRANKELCAWEGCSNEWVVNGFCDDHHPQKHKEIDMANHPPHYRGPRISSTGYDDEGAPSGMTFNRTLFVEVQCIDVIRHIKDIRLANAMKYIWRVAFGGKKNNREDIEKAMWYLQDWLDNKIDGQEPTSEMTYDV